MSRTLAALLLLALAGCAASPVMHSRAPSPCDAGEASYDCQVERYHNINAP